MKTLIKPKIKDKLNKALNYNNKALMIVFAFMVSLCALFTGGALSVTIQYTDFSLNGWTGGISWLWVPALLFFVMSILTGWSLYGKKTE